MFVTENPTATITLDRLADLGINLVELPANFVVRYMAMDAGGCWYLFDSLPIYDSGEWTIRSGHWHELGVEALDGGVQIPECGKGRAPRDSLIKIITAPNQ